MNKAGVQFPSKRFALWR